MRPYYTLFVRESDGLWVMELGSYDRSDIEFEREEFMGKGYRKVDTRLTKWPKLPKEAQIMQALADLQKAS